MIYFSQQIAQMKQIGKSLRSCLSAAPSACLAHADYIFMAHAETAESADFASRCALAAIRDVYTRRNADSCER